VPLEKKNLDPTADMVGMVAAETMFAAARKASERVAVRILLMLFNDIGMLRYRWFSAVRDSFFDFGSGKG